MKKPIAPLEKHDSHNVEIRLYTKGKHSAYYRCIDCDKFISWLSQAQTNHALELNLVATEPRKKKKALFISQASLGI